MLVQIITPWAVICGQDAEMVTIPGEEGVFGALPGHAPLIASLQPGIVKITSSGKDSNYFIYGGMSQVNNTDVKIVTEFGMDIAGAEKDKIRQELEELRKKIETLNEEEVAHTLGRTINTYETLLKFLS